MNLDFNADSKVNILDLVVAIKVFKALELEEPVVIEYINKLIKMIYK